MIARTWNVVWKELIQFARDRMLTSFLLLLPLVQLILLAQATGGQIGGLRVAVLDMDRSAASREMIARLDAREELAVTAYVEDEAALREMLDRDRAVVGVILTRGLAADLLDPHRPARVVVMVDGSNSIVGGIGLRAASGALVEYGQGLLRARGAPVDSPIDLRVMTYYNPTYNLRYFSIPAQVGFITYQITLSVASLGLARERELGTLEQLIVTPLRRLEIVLGKTIPALMIGALNFALMMTVALYFFHVPLRGSLLLLSAITALFILAEVGFGMLISAVSRTQQQAILFVFILAMVDISLSGYLVPVKNLPLALQAISRLAPMYHYLIAIRAVTLKGAGLATLWPHALALAAVAIVVLSVAIRAVSEQLD